MKRVVMCLMMLICFGSPVMAQQKALNIAGIHQLVADSKSEHERQSEGRDRQNVNALNEEVNKTMLAKLKNRYREIQNRFNFVGTIVLAVNVGMEAAPLVERISGQQKQLYLMAQKNPSLLFLVYGTELDFLQHSGDLIHFLVGLSASLGSINQMKISDRKILFDFALSELRTIAALSEKLIQSLQYGSLSSLIRSLNPFADYINTDKSLVEDIIRNAKYLKR